MTTGTTVTVVRISREREILAARSWESYLHLAERRSSRVDVRRCAAPWPGELEHGRRVTSVAAATDKTSIFRRKTFIALVSAVTLALVAGLVTAMAMGGCPRLSDTGSAG